MNRPILAFAFLAFASAALSAQQASPSNPYQGTANPPADDTIETSAQPDAQAAKPSAGKPMTAPAPAQPAQNYVPPAANYGDSTTGTDGGMVRGSQPAPTAERQPSLATRSYGSDPDGDIVHPDPLPPGVLGEGSTIRVRLLDRLSTRDSEKGDTFRSKVSSDVVENGQILIPTGAEIEGHVVDVSSGHVGSHGSMRLRPETVIMADGTRFRLDAYVAGAPGARARMDREGSIGADSRVKRDSIEYGGAVGTGAIAGAVMGGPAGALAGTIIGAGVVTVHLMVSHPQATLEPGTVLLFTLTQPLNLVAANAGTAEQQQQPAGVNQ
ncbi:MAG TPA: hypothetical protein VGG85_03745 [Terracidiphilus sp.]|jgi:hypothetical protein